MKTLTSIVNEKVNPVFGVMTLNCKLSVRFMTGRLSFTLIALKVCEHFMSNTTNDRDSLSDLAIMERVTITL